jgi:hypothetical protein
VPRPPPSIIAGPPIPMFASGVAMIVSHTPARAALPAKHRPETTATRRHLPVQGRQGAEGADVEPHPDDVRVAGTSAAALGEEHEGQAAPGRDVDDAVGLGVVAHALGSGEHGVVVGEHRGLPPVDGGDAGDHTVGGGVGDEVLLAAAGGLGRHGEGTVLDETALVDEVRDVLARAAAAAAVKFRRRLGTGLVEDAGRGGPGSGRGRRGWRRGRRSRRRWRRPRRSRDAGRRRGPRPRRCHRRRRGCGRLSRPGLR